LSTTSFTTYSLLPNVSGDVSPIHNITMNLRHICRRSSLCRLYATAYSTYSQLPSVSVHGLRIIPSHVRLLEVYPLILSVNT
jgi:hypothetical protein